MAASVLLLIPILIIVLLVFLAAGSKINAGKEGKMLVKNIYLYLVLFATLMMTIGGSVSIFMAAADIIAPTPYYQSFEDYKIMLVDRSHYDEGIPMPAETELRNRYDAAVLSHKQSQTARASNTLIKSFGWVVIPLPVFIYFQRVLVKKEKDEEQGRDNS